MRGKSFLIVLVLVFTSGCVTLSSEADLVSDTMNMDFDEENPFFTERANYYGDSLNRVEVSVWFYNIYERGEYTVNITGCDGLDSGADFSSTTNSHTLLPEQARLFTVELRFYNVPTATYTCEVSLTSSGEVLETTRFTARP